jgi:hypothetical protein
VRMRPGVPGGARSCGPERRWERDSRAPGARMRGSLRGTVLRFCGRARDVQRCSPWPVGRDCQSAAPCRRIEGGPPGCDASGVVAGHAAVVARPLWSADSVPGRGRRSGRRPRRACVCSVHLWRAVVRTPGAAGNYPAHQRRRPAAVKCSPSGPRRRRAAKRCHLTDGGAGATRCIGRKPPSVAAVSPSHGRGGAGEGSA